MSGLDPVPRPPVEPSGAGRAVPEPKRPKWLVPVIAGVLPSLSWRRAVSAATCTGTTIG